MKKKIAICIIILVIISIIFFITYKIKKEANKENKELLIDYSNIEENISEEDEKKVDGIAENQGFTGESNIYEMATEYDGRETVRIKPFIAYKVAISGAIMKEVPEFSKIDEILLKAPTHTGIWITENSREEFLNLLSKCAKATYTIDNDGYLKQEEKAFMNKYDKKINKMLFSSNLYVFDISSVSYLVDEVTGEIQEYPFEEMDPYTRYEYFEAENKQLYVISENKSGKVNQEDVLKEILENISLE